MDSLTPIFDAAEAETARANDADLPRGVPASLNNRNPVQSGITGVEVARRILRQEGIHNVDIIEHEEMLGDHYDPIHKRLVLLSANYHGSSAAALGVAAHECGHAIQHKMAYAPLQIRMAAVSVCNRNAGAIEPILRYNAKE